MSIKTRLLLSYVAMTFIPIMLFAMIAVTLFSMFFNDSAHIGNGQGKPAIWEMTNERNELFAAVKFLSEIDPDRFTDSIFLNNTDAQLNLLQAGLVVVKNNSILFTSPFLEAVDLDHELLGFQTDLPWDQWRHKINDRFTVEKFNITFSDQNSGTIYMLSDVNPFIEQARKFFPVLVLSLLCVIGLTNGILTYLVSRSIIKPLYALKHAAEEIKEGNLNHEVNLKRKDEIGQLGAAFEEMRYRLNESIHLQLQYEENRKELISNISHDLKTPITGIKACVQGIQDGIADTKEKQEKYMGMIAKKTDEMDRMIEELFLFSKLDLKRLPFYLEPMDLTAYLNDYVEELRLDPRLEDITITYFCNSKQPILVIADREKVHRVIVNMIDNSLKYMNKTRKEIKIELYDGAGEATVKIEDNGAGIEDKFLPYIFDRFYRVELSRNTVTGGSGLGLAIAKQIVEGHSGSIWAESHIGEGTSIYFTLQKIIYGGEQL